MALVPTGQATGYPGVSFSIPEIFNQATTASFQGHHTLQISHFIITLQCLHFKWATKTKTNFMQLSPI
jgi:hypothetical protein